MGPQGSCALGSATYERAPRAMGSTCTVTSPGQDNTSALWTWAHLLPTLASEPRTDSSRYLSLRLQGAGCPMCVCAHVPICMSVPVSLVCVWAPDPPWEEGRSWEPELAFLLLLWLVTTLMNI